MGIIRPVFTLGMGGRHGGFKMIEFINILFMFMVEDAWPVTIVLMVIGVRVIQLDFKNHRKGDLNHGKK